MLNLEATFLLPQSQHIHIFIASQGNMILEVIVSQRRIVEFFFFFFLPQGDNLFLEDFQRNPSQGFWILDGDCHAAKTPLSNEQRKKARRG